MENFKSKNDNNKYRDIVLDNGLKVVLISNEDLEESVAVMSVGVGYFNDPKEYMGLAHFLEHMLFMGSKSYPDIDYFSRIVRSAGGMDNAYTDKEETVYYFKVFNDEFDKILKVWSRFFIDPLFDESSVNKEIKAVHSEHQKNIQNDMWRKYQLLNESVVDTHPLSKFGTGSLETLNHGNIREALIKFYNEWYSSDKMKLVIYTNKPLSEMLKYLSLFQDISKREGGIDEFHLPVFKRKGVIVKPIQQINSINFHWVIKTGNELNKSSSLISLLFNNKSEGSLYNHLKEKGWIKNVDSGIVERTKNFKILGITLVLTEDGKDHKEEMYYLVNQYLLLIKSCNLRDYYEEIKAIQLINFHYQNRPDEMDTALMIANNLQIKESNYLNLDLFNEYDEEEVMEILNKLLSKPDLIIIEDSKKEMIEPKLERYYLIQYEEVDLDIREIEGSLKLPEKNIFIPKNFDLYPSDKTLKIEDTLYYFTENFNLPKMSMVYFFPYIFETAEDLVKLSLIVKVLSTKFRYKYYNAGLVDYSLGFKYDSQEKGFNLILQGFTDKMNTFVKKVLYDLENYNITEEEFNREIKEMYIEDQNLFFKSPWDLVAIYYSSINENLPTPDEIIKSYSKITYQSLPRIELKNYHLLVGGNITRDLILYKKTSPEKLQYNPKKLSRVDVFEKVNKDDPNQSTLISYYLGRDEKEYLASIALHLHYSDKFFNDMRTEKQLGYLVNLGLGRINDYFYLTGRIQSTVAPAEELMILMEDFIEELKRNKNEFDLDEKKKVMKQIIGKKEKNLMEMMDRYASRMLLQDFDRKEKLLSLIKSITWDDIDKVKQKLIKPQVVMVK